MLTWKIDYKMMTMMTIIQKGKLLYEGWSISNLPKHEGIMLHLRFFAYTLLLLYIATSQSHTLLPSSLDLEKTLKIEVWGLG